MKKHIPVLIVDDSSIIRQTISRYISGLNVEIVGSADNGERALKLFKEKKPAIVTLDITMPGMDGLTLLETMLKINADVKVMVVTALTDNSTGLKAMKMGAKSFITKPFTEKKLTDSLNRLLSEV